MNEFDIIQEYFATHALKRSDVAVGIGDDAAIVSIPAGHQLAVTTDTLVAGVHFLADTDPKSLGHKALAVNLSDLAAMAAKPAWVTLALTIPSINEAWLKKFCDGFFALANTFDVALIGGDLTHGPLSITIQAMGFLEINKGLRRSLAQIGDQIYVTGTLGDAGFALAAQKKQHQIPDYFLERLNKPTPRVREALALQTVAHAAIDISDGFIADLQHILSLSHVGARIHLDQLPLSSQLLQQCDKKTAIQFALTSGDDYELCFTAPKKYDSDIQQLSPLFNCSFTKVGEITATNALKLEYDTGETYHGPIRGYEHF